MGKKQIADSELRMLDRWHKFLEAQNGCYPATIAAIRLRMTPQGVSNAADRGWIAFFKIGRDRWYGRKDVARYEEKRAGEQNWEHYRSDEPKDFTEISLEKSALEMWNPLANTPRTHKKELDGS